jgi:hypothetical protein
MFVGVGSPLLLEKWMQMEMPKDELINDWYQPPLTLTRDEGVVGVGKA